MLRIIGVVLACVLIAACGGGGGGGTQPSPPPPPTFTVGGTVTGLAGSGLTLRNNAGAPLAVNGNGTFSFAGTVASGSAYDVTVGTQPATPSQTCVVANGAGSASANVTNIAVTCTTTTFSVGVTVSGLFGTGLVLENNAGDALTVSANGPTAFSTAIASGAAYNVAVRTQPTSTPPQTCTVPSGAGTVGNAAVTGVAVSCRAQAGRFVYVATAAPNAVAAFTIDANTGALTPIANFATTGQAPRVLFADRAGKFLYVYGDDNVSGPGATTLTGFTVDAQTGALTPIAGLNVSLPAAVPAPVVRHPNGNFIYLTVSDGTLSGNNRLHGFAIHPTTGALTNLPNLPFTAFAQGEVLNSVALSPNGASLYLAISTPAGASPPTGAILQYTVDAQTGELTMASSVGDAAGSFIQLFMHPAGTHIYTRNSTSAAQQYASRFTLDAATGAIGTRLDIVAAFGFGVIIAPGSNVYLPAFGGSFAVPAPGSVAGYVDIASGGIGAFPGSPYATNGSNSLAAVLDPTGRVIALTNLGTQNISVMKIDPVQRGLVHVAGSPYAPAVGTAPGTVTFDPSARFAYLTDGAGSISSYAVDVDTGVPTFAGSQPTGGSAANAPVVVLGLQ